MQNRTIPLWSWVSPVVAIALLALSLIVPVGVTSMIIDVPLVLGLDPKDLVLLLLTFIVAAMTLVTGRTHVMLGAVHLVIFAAFLFLALVP